MTLKLLSRAIPKRGLARRMAASVSAVLPIGRERRDAYETVDPAYDGVDAAAMIRPRNMEDVEALRSGLIGYLWGEAGFPTRTPDRVERSFEDEACRNVEGIGTLDRLTVRTEPHGIDSVAYLFHPARSNGGLVIYHQGHDLGGDFRSRKEYVGFFLARGYAVLALAMPLLGMNGRPVVDLGPLGPLKLTSHEHMHLLEGPELKPVKYFVEPVAVALNHALGEYPDGPVAMTGYSGGGWTTTLYAALDPRVRKSYPVASSLPQYMRAGPPNKPRNIGDYEQRSPELYRIANYLELYVLGASGGSRGRNQVHVLNQYDDRSSAGVNYRTFERAVRECVAGMGGRYEVWLDSTHREHKISDAALRVISRDLADDLQG